MNAVAERKRLRWETPIGVRGTVVITAETDSGFETRVIGGPLDGWTTPSKTRRMALIAHQGAVSMARSCD